MYTKNNHTTHYPALDGLRGLAILLVLLYHNFSFIPYLNYGWLGVDLFFVLSGYLITNILICTVDTKHYYKSYYFRRVLRIFPLYYLSLLLFILVLPAFFPFLLKLDFYTKNQIWFWSYFQNWLLIFKSPGDNVALNHFWSLAIEEQFYLVWPLVVSLIRNKKHLLYMCLAGLGLVIIVRFYIGNNTILYQNHNWLFLFTRIDGILIGAATSLILKINPGIITKYFTLLIFLIALFNLLVYYVNKEYNLNLDVWAICGFTTFSAIFGLTITELLQPTQLSLSKIFSTKFLRFFGKYSYGLYIFHWPLFVAFNEKIKFYLGILSSNRFLINMLGSLSITLFAIFIAIMSYHYFEIHFLKLKSKYNTYKE